MNSGQNHKDWQMRLSSINLITQITQQLQFSTSMNMTKNIRILLITTILFITILSSKIEKNQGCMHNDWGFNTNRFRLITIKEIGALIAFWHRLETNFPGNPRFGRYKFEVSFSSSYTKVLYVLGRCLIIVHSLHKYSLSHFFCKAPVPYTHHSQPPSQSRLPFLPHHEATLILSTQR